MKTFLSDYSKKEFPASEKVPARTIRHSILHLIQKENPEITHDSNISMEELNVFRIKYITEFLAHELGDLSEIEKSMLESLKSNSTLTDKLDGEDKKHLTTGQLIADKVASFGGSWTFIISFGIFILLWITLNIYGLSNRGFDPYPFILLNLILSCIAAIQAPIIMMSQNRQEEKDRDRAKNDYVINLKSELEIRMLHEKIDHFVMDQQQELLELQKEQLSLLNDLSRKLHEE